MFCPTKKLFSFLFLILIVFFFPAFATEISDFIKPQLTKEELLEELDQQATYKMILSHCPNISFGSLTLLENTFRMSDRSFSRIFSGQLRTKHTFQSIFDLVQERVCYLDYGSRIAMARIFRHLIVPRSVHKSGINQLGDYISEYILMELISNCSDKDILCDAYYELSQTYGHLLEPDMNRVRLGANDKNKGFLLCLPRKEIVQVDISTLHKLRVNLLKQSLQYNPKNQKAWIRLIEHLVFNKKAQNLSNNQLLYLSRKWKEHSEDSNFVLENKKDYINKIFQKAKDEEKRKVILASPTEPRRNIWIERGPLLKRSLEQIALNQQNQQHQNKKARH